MKEFIAQGIDNLTPTITFIYTAKEKCSKCRQNTVVDIKITANKSAPGISTTIKGKLTGNCGNEDCNAKMTFKISKRI